MPVTPLDLPIYQAHHALVDWTKEYSDYEAFRWSGRLKPASSVNHLAQDENSNNDPTECQSIAWREQDDSPHTPDVPTWVDPNATVWDTSRDASPKISPSPPRVRSPSPDSELETRDLYLTPFPTVHGPVRELMLDRLMLALPFDSILDSSEVAYFHRLALSTRPSKRDMKRLEWESEWKNAGFKLLDVDRDRKNREQEKKMLNELKPEEREQGLKNSRLVKKAQDMWSSYGLNTVRFHKPEWTSEKLLRRKGPDHEYRVRARALADDARRMHLEGRTFHDEAEFIGQPTEAEHYVEEHTALQAKTPAKPKPKAKSKAKPKATSGSKKGEDTAVVAGEPKVRKKRGRPPGTTKSVMAERRAVERKAKEEQRARFLAGECSQDASPLKTTEESQSPDSTSQPVSASPGESNGKPSRQASLQPRDEPMPSIEVPKDGGEVLVTKGESSGDAGASSQAVSSKSQSKSRSNSKQPRPALTLQIDPHSPSTPSKGKSSQLPSPPPSGKKPQAPSQKDSATSNGK